MKQFDFPDIDKRTEADPNVSVRYEIKHKSKGVTKLVVKSKPQRIF